MSGTIGHPAATPAEAGAPASAGEAGHSLGIRAAPNLRDLGGYPTADGARVRRGVLYRSGQLDRLEGDDADAFARLGIGSVYDLRTRAERVTHPDVLPPPRPDGTPVDYLVADVLGGGLDMAAARLPELLGEPRGAEDGPGDPRVSALLSASYRNLVTLPAACDAYGKLLRGIAAAAGAPVLFHCTAGKDRAGWAAAVLLTLLGVPDELVMRDYLQSNQYVLPIYQGLLARVAAGGGYARTLEAMLRVEPEYLDAAFEQVRERHGTLERYLTDALGVDAAAQAALRQASRTSL